METTFVDDLGADSLDVFQIIMGIEENLMLTFQMRMQKIFNCWGCSRTN